MRVPGSIASRSAAHASTEFQYNREDLFDRLVLANDNLAQLVLNVRDCRGDVFRHDLFGDSCTDQNPTEASTITQKAFRKRGILSRATAERGFDLTFRQASRRQ